MKAGKGLNIQLVSLSDSVPSMTSITVEEVVQPGEHTEDYED